MRIPTEQPDELQHREQPRTPEIPWWGSGPAVYPPCHPLGRTPDAGLLDDLRPARVGADCSRLHLRTVSSAGNKSGIDAGSKVPDSFSVYLYPLKHSLLPHVPEATPILGSAGGPCCLCRYPCPGRTVCFSYQMWIIDGAEVEDLDPLSSLPLLQWHIQHCRPGASRMQWMVVLGKDDSIGAGLQVALQAILPGEECLLLMRKEAVSHAMASGIGSPCCGSRSEDRQRILVRLKLHYQTQFQPLRLSAELYRSHYRMMLFPLPPKGRSEHQHPPKPPTVFREDCTDVGTGLSALNTLCPVCRCAAEDLAADTASDASVNSEHETALAVGACCKTCLRDKEQRRLRSAKRVSYLPCPFVYRYHSSCDSGVSAADAASQPTDGCQVVVEFSLSLPAGMPFSLAEFSPGCRRSRQAKSRSTCSRIQHHGTTASDSTKTTTVRYTLDAEAVCPGLDLCVRSMKLGERVDLWLPPLWAVGEVVAGDSSVPGLPSASGCAAVSATSLTHPALLGKPLYLRGLVLQVLQCTPQPTELSPPQRLVLSARLREEGNTFLASGDPHKAARRYARAAEYANVSAYEGGTAAWALEAARLNQSLAMLRLRRWRQALALTDMVLLRAPNNPKALYRKAQALLGLGRLEEARALCLKAHSQLSSEGSSQASAFLLLLQQIGSN